MSVCRVVSVAGCVVAVVGIVGVGSLMSCVDRNRQAALDRLQVVVDEQRQQDSACDAKLTAAVDIKARADVAFDCKQKRAAQLERYRGLLTMVEHPSPEERVPSFPEETQAVKDAPIDGDGQRLFMTRRCIVCHSIDGSALVGPTVRGLYGAEVVHTDGSVAVVDDVYLREAILTPNRRVHKGFVPVMPEYQSELNVASVDVIIAYLRTLTATPPAAPPAVSPR